MKRKTFGDFCDKKKRESIRQLRILKQLLEKSGMKVVNFLESDGDNDPHIYCMNPTKSGSFEGLRIYKIGDQLAFRVQKESDTHPYGSAYPLPVEDMFQDFLSDEGIDQHKAGKKVIEAVNSEIRRFFDKSVEAEREDRERNIETGQDGAGNVLMRSSGTDYSSLIYNKGN
jgi:hypothetical protein